MAAFTACCEPAILANPRFRPVTSIRARFLSALADRRQGAAGALLAFGSTSEAMVLPPAAFRQEL